MKFLMYHSFYTHEEFFSNNLDVKSIQIYTMLIRLVVTYGAETWTLTVTEENALIYYYIKKECTQLA
jgi:hypothetical protein